MATDREPAVGREPAGSGAAVPSTREGSVPGVESDVDALLGLVDRLADVLAASELEELEVEAGGTTLRVRRTVADPQPPTMVEPEPPGGASVAATRSEAGTPLGEAEATPPDGGADTAAAAGAAEAPEAPPRPFVKAPLTGIWYASPAPGTAPFVQVGGEVAVGQVIGLIEAMKLFNEIKSDLAGRVVRICVENGQLVKAKQPLIEVEPL